MIDWTTVNHVMHKSVTFSLINMLRLALCIMRGVKFRDQKRREANERKKHDKGVSGLNPVWQTWKWHLELRLGEVRWFTCATPVTVRATPSAVSTSSHLGCRVIISRVILWKTQKRETNQKSWLWSTGRMSSGVKTGKKVGLKKDVKVNNTKWICRVKTRRHTIWSAQIRCFDHEL